MRAAFGIDRFDSLGHCVGIFPAVIVSKRTLIVR
jgi:hypothetical protein